MVEMIPMPVILGAPRSGTTLLRFMIDAHPDVAIPPETGFLTLGTQFTGTGDELRQEFFETITAFPPGMATWPDFGIPKETSMATAHFTGPMLDALASHGGAIKRRCPVCMSVRSNLFCRKRTSSISSVMAAMLRSRGVKPGSHLEMPWRSWQRSGHAVCRRHGRRARTVSTISKCDSRI